MGTSIFPRSFARFRESVQGTGPADAAAWVAGGTRLRVVSGTLDPSTIVQSAIEDDRSQTTIFGKETKVLGIKNGEVPVSVHLGGAEASPGDGNQVAATAISNFLESAMGGQWRGYQTDLKTAGAHTTGAVELTSSTGYDEGGFLAVEDADDPGVLYPRRITGVAGDVMTLDQLLPFTPADGDTVYPVIAVHVDELVLVNSDGAGGPYTDSYLVEAGLSGSGESWELNGCVPMLTGVEIGRDGLLKAALSLMYSSFKDPTAAPSPSWTAAPSGQAGVPIGPACTYWLQDYGSTAANSVHVNEIGVEPGVPRVRVETNSTVEAGMQGTARFSTEPADTMVTLNLVPFATSHWTDFQNRAIKVFRFATTRAAGQNMGIHVSRAEIVESPQRGEAGQVSSSRLVLRAHPDLDNSAAADAQLWKSKLTFLFY